MPVSGSARFFRYSHFQILPGTQAGPLQDQKTDQAEDVNIKNQTFKHNYTEVVTMCLIAAWGCDNQFEVKIYPVSILSKILSGAPNEYKRIRHLRQSAGKTDWADDEGKRDDGDRACTLKEKEADTDDVEAVDE